MVSLGYSQGKSTIKEKCSAYKMWKYWHLGCWYIKSTLYNRFFNCKKNLQKNKVVAGKTLFFVLTLASEMAILYGNDAFSILLVSAKKRYSYFEKKVFIFQKIAFKVKVLKTLKISIYCHVKTCWSCKPRVILKIPSTLF